MQSLLIKDIMSKKVILILVCLFFQHLVYGQMLSNVPRKVKFRIEELNSKDSLITYYKDCSGCTEGYNASILFLYKKNKKSCMNYIPGI